MRSVKIEPAELMSLDCRYDCESSKKSKRKRLNFNGDLKNKSSCKGSYRNTLPKSVERRKPFSSGHDVKLKSSCQNETNLKGRRMNSNDDLKFNTFNCKDSNVDYDYITFLNLLTQNNYDDDDDDNDGEDGEKDVGEENEDEEEEDDDDDDDFVEVDEEEEDRDRVRDVRDVNRIDVEDDLDPQYKTFFENLREDGKSYILEMKTEKGTSVHIKYEDGSSPFQFKRKVQSNLGNISPKGMSDFANKNNFEPEHLNCKETPQPRRSRCKSGRTDDSHPFLEECKPAMIPMVDDSYYEFLKHVRISGKILFMKSDNWLVQYGDYDEIIQSDAETSLKQGNPCPKEPQLEQFSPNYDVHMDEDDRGPYSTRSEYEKKLWRCLNMPYSEQEFADKYREATYRKQSERHRDLRGRSVSYATETSCPSYLDNYPDLDEMVDRALSRHDAAKALSLLRCLFFFLENVSHEGSFLPWKDPSIVEMILGPVTG